MAGYDFRTPRLYVDVALAAGAAVALDGAQANYLGNVLRLKAGDPVLVFNGRDGEWRATLAGAKRKLSLAVGERTREQTPALDLHYLFAPLKHARLDYMVQKAVEMGAARLQPVLTRHAQVARVNLERMRANAIEAAEQCGILTLPEICAPLPLARAIAARAPERLLVFCDEDAQVKDPVAALAARACERRGPIAAGGADRSGGRLCGGRARGAARAAQRGAARARAAHPARRYRGGGGAGAGGRGARRLAAMSADSARASGPGINVRAVAWRATLDTQFGAYRFRRSRHRAPGMTALLLR